VPWVKAPQVAKTARPPGRAGSGRARRGTRARSPTWPKLPVLPLPSSPGGFLTPNGGRRLLPQGRHDLVEGPLSGHEPHDPGSESTMPRPSVPARTRTLGASARLGSPISLILPFCAQLYSGPWGPPGWRAVRPTSASGCSAAVRLLGEPSSGVHHVDVAVFAAHTRVREPVAPRAERDRALTGETHRQVSSAEDATARNRDVLAILGGGGLVLKLHAQLGNSCPAFVKEP